MEAASCPGAISSLQEPIPQIRDELWVVCQEILQGFHRHNSMTTATAAYVSTSAGGNTNGLQLQISTCNGSTSVYGRTTSGFTPSSSNPLTSGLSTTTYSNIGFTASTTYYYIANRFELLVETGAVCPELHVNAGGSSDIGDVPDECGGVVHGYFVVAAAGCCEEPLLVGVSVHNWVLRIHGPQQRPLPQRPRRRRHQRPPVADQHL
jgi:hypothetical protein